MYVPLEWIKRSKIAENVPSILYSWASGKATVSQIFSDTEGQCFNCSPSSLVAKGLYPTPHLRQCIALFAFAKGWLLLDIGWFVLFLNYIFFYQCFKSPKHCQQYLDARSWRPDIWRFVTSFVTWPVNSALLTGQQFFFSVARLPKRCRIIVQ